MLYELVTGQRPFAGATLTAILFSLLTRHPTPTTELAAGDEDLWEILARGLQKSPPDRWPEMRTFGAALATWAVQRGIATDATGTSLTHHWLATPSRPPEGAADAAPLSAVPARAPLSVPARLGTLETTYVAAVNPPRRRTRAMLAAWVAALVVAPVLLGTGMYAHRGASSAGPGATFPVLVTEASAPVVVVDVSPANLPSAAPLPLPSPSAAATASARAAAPPSIRLRPVGAAPAGRSRWASTAMPLPMAPNF